MSIAIIDYDAGNIRSVQYALERLGYSSILSSEERIIRDADRVIFPGVGNAGAAMESLRKKGLDTLIPSLTQPVLGICVGMQLMCSYSEEDNTKGLGIVDAKVKKFIPTAPGQKIPHMGWNTINDLSSELFNGIVQDEFVYYVHSYYMELCPDTIATTMYGNEFSSAVRRDNFYGVQFHTEKSASAGDTILSNFLTMSL